MKEPVRDQELTGTMSGQVLELENVTPRCGGTPVRDVSLTIPREFLHGFFGSRRSWKPMTIRMICDLTKPTLQWIRRAAA
jgi:ABC-type multidrug transport system ATPase subunit